MEVEYDNNLYNEIEGYLISEVVVEGVRCHILRAKSIQNGKSVFIKILKSKLKKSTVGLRSEYHLLNTLSSVPNIYYPIEFHSTESTEYLVFEDFGGTNLRRYLQTMGPFKHSLNLFYDLAINITTILGQIHERHVIHKEMKPDNIIWNSTTNEVKIAEFGSAVIFSPLNDSNIILDQNSDIITAKIPALVSLGYIAPEQIVNHTVSFNADLYSLGITFYELISGKFPYKATSRSELLHSHLALEAPPLTGVGSLSKIVAKMMAKSPQDRYQSAIGVRRDLLYCKDYPNDDTFEPGRYDVSMILKLPAKLYGREESWATILNAYEYCLHNNNKENSMAIVYGVAGSGKTTIINQLKKKPEIFFISGKFSLEKSFPYSALIEAASSLIEQVMFEEDFVVNEKRKLLKEQLGMSAKFLTNIVPSLHLLIDVPIMSPEDLSPTELQNCLIRAFVHFFRILSGQFKEDRKKMLVLFLDDIQWADEPSLLILEGILTSKEVHFFTIAGCRQQEMDENLKKHIQEFSKKNVRITEIFLQDLDISSINQLIKDTLHCSEVTSLADLVYQKTKGNPFFVARFLTILSQKELLVFNVNTRCWSWDLEKIRDMGFTDNVIEFLVTTMGNLHVTIISMLQVASCFGTTFDVESVAEILNISRSEVEGHVWSAIREGYLKRIGDNEYAFVHDRIHQTAYSMIDKQKMQELHLKIGNYFKSKYDKDLKDDYLFDLVYHMNNVELGDIGDRLKLAEYNLKAGIKAKKNLAYKNARDLFRAGTNLLPPNSWNDYHSLTFDLFLELATTLYLCKDSVEAEKIYEICLKNSIDVYEKVRVYLQRSSMYVEKMMYQELISNALECLKLLGVEIPLKPSVDQVLKEISLVYSNINSRQIQSLIQLPQMTSPHHKAITNMLNKTFVGAVFFDTNLSVVLSAKIVNMSILHGNSPLSCYAYIMFGWSESRLTKDFSHLYEWGQLGFDLCELYCSQGSFADRGQVWTCYASCINWMKNPVNTDLEYCLKAFDYCIEYGDYLWAGITCYHGMSSLYASGRPLPESLKLGQKFIDFNRNVTVDIGGMTELYAKSMRELCGLGTFSEEFIEQILKEGSPLTKGCLYMTSMRTKYCLEDYEGAYRDGNTAKEYLHYYAGFRDTYEYYFYRALVLCEVYARHNPKDQELLFEEIQQCVKEIANVAFNAAPCNFMHKYLILDAEVCRLVNHLPTHDILSKFTESIKISEENGFVSDIALAKELTGKFVKKCSEQMFSDSSRVYSRWGSSVKCQLLKKHTARKSLDLSKPLAPPLQETAYFLSSEFDLEAVISASQELSSIVDARDLCNTLLTILVKNAGATKGVLLLQNESKLEVECAVVATDKGLETLGPVPMVTNDIWFVSSTVVHYCWRTVKTLVVSDVTQEDLYARDPYMLKNHVYSVLCSPLLLKGNATGLIYLENSVNRGTFTDERLRIIRILGSQLMISLENAWLVSRLKQNTIELQQKNEKLKEVDKLKDEFLAMTSHEFRTPLHGVIGMTSLLKDTSLTPEQMDYVQHITNSADSLLVLVTDILDLSRLQARKVRLEDRPFHLLECIESAIDIVEYRGIMKGLNIAYFVEKGTSEMLIGDRSRLKQILINLLNNAIKFTETGEVTIRVKPIKKVDMMEVLEFQVTDTGIGMNQEESQLLFKPFSQIDTSYSRNYTGSGLGLVICKNLCELMNGQIWLSSERDKGSTFYFSIPFKIYSESAIQPMLTEDLPIDSSFTESVPYFGAQQEVIRSLAGCFVYLRNATNEMALQNFLDPIPVQILADKTEFGMAINKEYPLPAIFITDLQTGEENVSLLAQCRHFVFIAMVPTMQKRASVTLMSLPNVSYLRVPLRKSHLLMLVNNVFSQDKKRKKSITSPQMPTTLEHIVTEEKKIKNETSPMIPETKPYKILVVEDNLVNQKIMVKMLDRLGYEVMAANDGFQAIEAAKSNRFDVILMDVHMPTCSGLEATIAIREYERDLNIHTPIIAVTASVADELSCINAGMDDFIAKPISKTFFLSKLEKWIRTL